MAYGDAETLFSEVGSELGKRILQMSTIPSASVDYLNMIIQYIGTTSETYTNGYFYKCIYDDDNSEYIWINVEVQDGGSGGYLGTGTLLASGWSSKQQTLTFAGYKASMNGVIGIPTDATAAQKAAYTDALVDVVSQSGNSFTFKVENVPSIDLPVVLYAGGGSGSGGGGEDVGLDVGSNGAIQSTYIDELEQEQTEDLFCNDTGNDIVTLLDSIADNVRLLNQPEVYAPIVYSTEEREIGVWTDGKPLYQITIDSINDNNWHDISNLHIETVVHCHGNFITNNQVYEFALNADGSYTSYIQIGLDYNRIMLVVNGWTASKRIVTLLYTKTTDTAGSGHYTALGVPAVHYSESERVIGAWIDGKPIYQKTLYHAGSVSGTVNIQHGIENLSKVINYSGMVSDESGIPFPLPRIAYDNNNVGVMSVDTTNISMNNPSAFGTRLNNWYVTIQYTKTTD